MTTLDQNISKLASHLHRFEAVGIKNRIAGQDVEGAGGVFASHSPVDKSKICDVARGTGEDIDKAACAAHDAFADWRDMKATERRKLMIRIAEGIEARAEEIALCECWDTGQAYKFMSKAALRGAENFRYFADQVVQARAAGCTVVHNPAELSPLTARLLVDIAEEAGLPPGVLNTVNGFGEEAGKALCEHPKIKAIAFVGESSTGSMIVKQGADTLKRNHLELGGKNPVVVFEDADLDRALDAVIFMIYSINGERCTSSSRLLVQNTIRAEFEQRLAERVRNIRVGHPLDPATEIGPLIGEAHFSKVTRYFDIARDEGATIAAGGDVIGDSGYFVAPTLFTNADNSMKIAREEIFGPVLTSIPFESEEEALTLANDTDYGLTGYLWTNDLTRALRFTDRLEAGMIWVNSENVRHLPTPFGGVKASGIGRDGGDWSFEFYMEQKHIGFATGQHKITKLGAL